MGERAARVVSMRVGTSTTWDRESSRQLWKGSTAGRSLMHQQRWRCFSGNISRKGQNMYSRCKREDEKKCERNSLQTLRSGEKGGRCAPSTGAEIPLWPVKTMENQVVLLQPMEEHVGADINTIGHRQLHSTEKPVLMEAAYCGKSAQENVERSPSGSIFSHKTYSLWGTYTGTVCFWRTAPHGSDPCWSRVINAGC